MSPALPVPDVVYCWDANPIAQARAKSKPPSRFQRIRRSLKKSGIGLWRPSARAVLPFAPAEARVRAAPRLDRQGKGGVT